MARLFFVHITFITAALAACAPSTPDTHVVDLTGPRNDAFRAAAERYDLPLDWLVALGFEQGRFEATYADDDARPPALVDLQREVIADDPDALSSDVPLDDTDDPQVDDPSPIGDDVDTTEPPRFGVMYLTDAQVARAVELTGATEDALRTDLGANIDGAAAILADALKVHGTDLRTATTELLGLDDPDAAGEALADLDGIIAQGFDLTTSDGERLAMIASDPTPPSLEDSAANDDTDVDAIALIAPGTYPPRHWIPSPNHSSRLGYRVRFIVIHDIEGTMASAISVFKSSANQASAHYIIRASDGRVVQMVHEGDNAWHTGHGWFNRHSVGIEHEGFALRKHGGGYYTDGQYRASARLACAIAHRYAIPVDRHHIFGHFNVPSILSSHTLCSDARGIAGKCGGTSHHRDPGRYWNWTKYMTLVRQCVHTAAQ